MSNNIPKELIPSDPRFGCGPSMIPLNHVDSLAATRNKLLGTSHRKSAVKNLVKEVQVGIAKYFNVPSDYEIVIGNGGATLFFDMLALGAVKEKVLHHVCGEFSSKWYLSSKAVPWIEAEKLEVPFGEGLQIESRDGFDTICATLNETSTGVIFNNLPDVDDQTIICIDATSGAGQVECDITKTDIFFFSPQKVFASEGGLWIAIMSPKALKRVEEIENLDRYIPPFFSFKTAVTNSQKNQTYNTPASSTLFLLNEQIKLMNKSTYKEVVAVSKKKAALLYNWANEKSYLSAYIKDPQYQSYSVATIDVDENVDVTAILKDLDDKFIVHGIDSYRKLGRNQFRISMFYNNSYEDLEKLTKLLSYIIEK